MTKSYPTLFQESGLCTKHGVSGYPTIKYFLSGDKTPKDFSGGRQLDALRKFTAVRSLLELDMDNFCVIIGELQDTLEVKCDVIDPKGCSEKEVKFIETMKAKTSEERGKELTRLSNMKVWHKLCLIHQFSFLITWFDQAGSMKPELKQWLVQRLNVLKQLQA